jgi:hypothetical protein
MAICPQFIPRRGIAAVIPVKEDQKKHRRARGRACGRLPVFDAARCKERNAVERCFSKLRQFRAVATRYDKRDFMAPVVFNDGLRLREQAYQAGLPYITDRELPARLTAVKATPERDGRNSRAFRPGRMSTHRRRIAGRAPQEERGVSPRLSCRQFWPNSASCSLRSWWA